MFIFNNFILIVGLKHVLHIVASHYYKSCYQGKCWLATWKTLCSKKL